MNPLFISGIGTDVGKTVVSAILVEKLKADYWKPVQTGYPPDSDTQRVKSLIGNLESMFHPETFLLPEPLSPHEAAERAGRSIQLKEIRLPSTNKRLIIEGAGGLMVPLNEQELMFHLILSLRAELILVSKNYLGSINHTLLSLDLIKQYEIPFRGIVFSGEENPASERVILEYSGAQRLGRIPHLNPLNRESVVKAGSLLQID